MRKKGNHTNAPQWLYLMWAVPQIWLVKIGISGGLKYRAKRISETIRGFVVPIFVIRIPFAYDVEQWLHRVFSFAHAPQKGVSGGSEFFAAYIAPMAVVLMLFIQLFYWSILVSAALFLSWLLAGCPKI